MQLAADCCGTEQPDFAPVQGETAPAVLAADPQSQGAPRLRPGIEAEENVEKELGHGGAAPVPECHADDRHAQGGFYGRKNATPTKQKDHGLVHFLIRSTLRSSTMQLKQMFSLLRVSGSFFFLHCALHNCFVTMIYFISAKKYKEKMHSQPHFAFSEHFFSYVQ